MTFQEFDKYVEEMFGELQKLKSTKGREYTEGSPDRFANFNKLANELHLHRYKIWQVYFAKHLSAIYSYIENGREFSEETIQGRIKDAVMYLLLLGGMIQASQDLAFPLLSVPINMSLIEKNAVAINHPFDPTSVSKDLADAISTKPQRDIRHDSDTDFTYGHYPTASVIESGAPITPQVIQNAKRVLEDLHNDSD